MAAQPVRQCLAQCRFSIGVVGCAEQRHKYLRRMDLAVIGTDDRHRGSAVIDEAFLAGLVGLAHGALLPLMPMVVAITELRVAVAAVGVLLGVLLPQQLLGHPLALEFLMDDRPVGYLVTSGGTGIGAGIKQPGQLIVIQFRWQWPGKSQLIGCRQQLLDGADTGLGAGVDLTDRQPGGLS
jgi:hypothetical protein